MGFFDDAVQDAVPGGSLAKPIAIAIGALLLKNMLSRKSEPEPAPAPAPSPSLPPLGGDGGGGLIGGLGDLVSKFEKAGQGGTIGSWIGTGQNQPIQPGQLGSTLGQTTISDLARAAGVSEQDLLAGLAQALPGVIDKLTPRGRLPTAEELSAR
ncbi:MAG: YidB family protein [Rhodoblastus sp.]